MIKYDWRNRLSPADAFVDDYKKQISELSNAQLLEYHTDLAAGDDYDGCHTKQGMVVFNLLTEELYERLKDWLAKE